MSDGLLRCRSCRGRTSLTAGTVFQDTCKPLRLWFLAMRFVTSQKSDVNALDLQRVLGPGGYETSWTWLHKLRRAMVGPGRDRLADAFGVDEIYVGGPEEDKRSREAKTKILVALAAEKSGQFVVPISQLRIF